MMGTEQLEEISTERHPAFRVGHFPRCMNAPLHSCEENEREWYRKATKFHFFKNDCEATHETLFVSFVPFLHFVSSHFSLPNKSHASDRLCAENKRALKESYFVVRSYAYGLSKISKRIYSHISGQGGRDKPCTAPSLSNSCTSHTRKRSVEFVVLWNLM